MKFKFTQKQKSYFSIHTYKGIDFLIIPNLLHFGNSKNNGKISMDAGFRIGVNWIGLIFWLFIYVKKQNS